MNIASYIPHRPPMQLVQTLISHGEREALAGATVYRDNAFYDAGCQGVPAWTGLEYMAQTAAAWVGLQDERLQRPVEPAFLLSSRHFSAHQPVFALNSQLRIYIHADLIDGSLVAFSGRITDSTDTLLAEAVFTAYRPDDAAAYLLAGNATDNDKGETI